MKSKSDLSQKNWTSCKADGACAYISVLRLFRSVLCCEEQGYRPNTKGREHGRTMLKRYVGSMNEFRQLRMAVPNELQGGTLKTLTSPVLKRNIHSQQTNHSITLHCSTLFTSVSLSLIKWDPSPNSYLRLCFAVLTKLTLTNIH